MKNLSGFCNFVVYSEPFRDPLFFKLLFLLPLLISSAYSMQVYRTINLILELRSILISKSPINLYAVHN